VRRSLVIVVAVLGLLSLFAAAASAASGPPRTSTTVLKDVPQEPYFMPAPCSGKLAIYYVTESSVSHVVDFPDGTTRVVFQHRTDLFIDTLDPTAADYTVRSTGGAVTLLLPPPTSIGGETVHGTGVGSGTDGSRIFSHMVFHLTVNANGDVTSVVDKSRFETTCA
jgi:hypothetical protein